jgi:hypothetical protein
MKKTKIMRVRQTTYDKLNQKRNIMEQNLKNLIGKPQRIKMIDLVDLMSQKSMFVHDSELKNFFGKKKRRIGGMFL